MKELMDVTQPAIAPSDKQYLSESKIKRRHVRYVFNKI